MQQARFFLIICQEKKIERLLGTMCCFTQENAFCERRLAAARESVFGTVVLSQQVIAYMRDLKCGERIGAFFFVVFPQRSQGSLTSAAHVLRVGDDIHWKLKASCTSNLRPHI